MPHLQPAPAKKDLIPTYRGEDFVPVPLPHKIEDWSAGGAYSIVTEDGHKRALIDGLQQRIDEDAWAFPKREIMFFSDLHGDPEAFCDSLVGAGAVKRTGPAPSDFALTARGRNANMVIGGDCFDKGPSSLGVLRLIRQLKDQGARLRVLAGNHDVRVLFGMMVVGRPKDVKNEHFFIRTGQKILPMLQEVWQNYLAGKDGLTSIPGEKTCRRHLYPRKSWFDAFPDAANDHMGPEQLARELSRIDKKFTSFEQKAADMGLSLRQVYAAVKKWQQLFLEKDAEFAWFFKSMRLCYKSGSFLFLHAGVDDSIARRLGQEGVSALNRDFRAAIKAAPFDFYYGSLCNVIRTKYRKVDLPFTRRGGKALGKAGIAAIIHGHRNLHHGQRLSWRRGVMNFECDTSLDRATRKKEQVAGKGASTTIIHPDGYILGISSDWPKIKYFHPEKTLRHLQKQEREGTSAS